MPQTTKRRRYVLYLRPHSDSRLITHLDSFGQDRGIGEEMRRMLYLALDGVPSQLRPAAPARPETASAPIPASSSGQVDPDPGGKGARLKKMFGMPS